MADLDAADALIRHCREHGITLLYDLDDDLRHIPRDHPDAQLLRPRARLVSRLVRGADAVWVSTPALAATLAELRDDVRVVENGLDERLWTVGPPPPPRQGPVRILFMGTATHDADFAIVEGALARLKSVFAEHVSVDLLGVSSRADLPSWVNRIGMPVNATSSYPGFVNWITQQHWDIGDRAARRYAVQSLQVGDQDMLDYAAHGPAGAGLGPRRSYRGTLADGPAAGWCRMTRTPGSWRCPPGARRRLRRRLPKARAWHVPGRHRWPPRPPPAAAAWLRRSAGRLGAEEATIDARDRPGRVAGITIRFPGATGGAPIG